MDIIDQRVRNINRLASARKNRSMSESDLAVEQDEPIASMTTNDPMCAASSPQLHKTGGVGQLRTSNETAPIANPVATPRKRKLFAPSDPVNFGSETSIVEAVGRDETKQKTESKDSEAAKRARDILNESTKLSDSKRVKTMVAPKKVVKKVPVVNRRRTTMDFVGERSKTKTPVVVPTNQPRLDKFLVSTNMHREQIAFIQEVGRT